MPNEHYLPEVMQDGKIKKLSTSQMNIDSSASSLSKLRLIQSMLGYNDAKDKIARAASNDLRNFIRFEYLKNRNR